MKTENRKTTNDGRNGGELKGLKHSEGGMPAIVVNAGDKPIEVETDEIIIKADSAQCTDCKHDFDGRELTNKEILSEINQEKGGVAIMGSGGDVMENGGGVSETQFEQFEKIVKNSKTFEDAFKKAQSITGISSEVAQNFREKYDPDKKLTPKQSFEIFYNEIKNSKDVKLKALDVCGKYGKCHMKKGGEVNENMAVLDEPNSIYTVIEPFNVFVLTGYKESNQYYGSSRIQQPVYESYTVQKGDEIQNLFGGLFLATKNKMPFHVDDTIVVKKHIEEIELYPIKTEVPEFAPFEKKYGRDYQMFDLSKLELKHKSLEKGGGVFDYKIRIGNKVQISYPNKNEHHGEYGIVVASSPKNSYNTYQGYFEWIVELENGEKIPVMTNYLKKIAENIKSKGGSVESEFMRFWLNESDEAIIGFLLEMGEDELLNEVVKPETYDIEHGIVDIHGVFYKDGMSRKDLVLILIKLDDDAEPTRKDREIESKGAMPSQFKGKSRKMADGGAVKLDFDKKDDKVQIFNKDGENVGFIKFQAESESDYVIVDAKVFEEHRRNHYYTNAILQFLKENPQITIYSSFRSHDANFAWSYLIDHLPAGYKYDKKMYPVENTVVLQLNYSPVPQKMAGGEVSDQERITVEEVDGDITFEYSHNDINFTGSLKTYNTGRGNDYNVETDWFADAESEKYWDDNWEELSEKIKKIHSDQFANGGVAGREWNEAKENQLEKWRIKSARLLVAQMNARDGGSKKRQAELMEERKKVNRQIKALELLRDKVKLSDGGEITEYKYALTSRPFGLGTYPSYPDYGFLRFEDDNTYGTFGIIVYSKPLPLDRIRHFSLFPITEIKKYEGRQVYYYEDKKANVKIVNEKSGNTWVHLELMDGNGKIIDMNDISGADFLGEVENGEYTLVTD